jgi:hypothetical protein
MKLRAAEAEYAPQLRRFLGPEWSKLRLATVGKRVVVLLGSDTALLDKAIANLKSDEPGLQADDRYRAFHARTPAKATAEFHLRLGRSQQLATAGVAVAPPANKSPATTSLGVTITPQSLRLDLFAPIEEVKSVAAQINAN